MENIKNCLLNNIYGGNANSNYEGGGARHKSKNKGGVYGGVDSCGAGIFAGLVAGSTGGPIGMVTGVVAGMIGGQCRPSSFGSDGQSNISSGRNYGAQCTW